VTISIVAFDMYGTLLDGDALQDVVREYSPMAVESFCAEWRKRQLQLANAASSTGRYMDFDRITLTALHEVAARFHVRLAPADQKRLIDAWAAIPAFDDASRAFEIVRRHRLPVAVITNAVESTARNALAHAGIADDVDRVISADAVRSFKPSAVVYAQVLEHGMSPENVLFVSSNDWDAMGARQAGFHSVWVNRKRMTGGPKAERTIGDLSEIEIVLNEFAAV
jgi:2-haloacid dehalogenase